MPGYPCCCSKCKICTCEACSDSPFYAPCCWKVVISGIVDGSCDDCEVLNKTYYLSQADDESEITPEGCSWFEGAVCGDCNPTDIWLTVFQDGSDYIIEVTMDGHVWHKNYGTTKPECCGLKNETIPHVTNSGDCDTSSATCVVTALADGQACETSPCTVTCSTFQCPESWAVDLGVGGLTDRDCSICDEVQGIYVVDTDPPGACNWFFTRTVLGCTEERSVRLFFPNSTGTYFYVYQSLFKGFGLVLTGWKSSIWDSIANPTCLYLADGDGKIPLSLEAVQTGTGCDGALPTSIQIWDANA